VGQWWMAYAAWTSPSTTYRSGGARTLRIDKVSFSGTTPYISGPTWTPQLVTEPVRVAGADRYATAAALAGRYAPGVPVVYLATGQRFSDALAAGPAGAVNHGPVLLTTTSSLPAATAAELSRLAPHEVVVLGGASAVSATVVSQVAAITHVDVARLAGADRYATAAAISAATFSSHVAVVYVATGATFPDALTGSAAAAHMGAPVLLVSPSGIPESTAKELTRLAPSSIVALGGSQALSTSVVAGLSRFSPNVTQVAGPDRYATAAALAGQTFQGPLAEVLLATGTSFPDALAAAPFGEPVLLVPHTGSSVAVTDELAQLAPQRILPVGGPSAVSDSALVALR
jgi:putative cell wall-binding protein